MKLIEKLWNAACRGNIKILKLYHKNCTNVLNIRYVVSGIGHSLIMGALVNNQFETVDYLISIGETVTKEENRDISNELKRLEYMDKIVKNQNLMKRKETE